MKSGEKYIITLFCYNVDEIPRNLCLCQLAYDKIGLVIYIISLQVAEPSDDVKQGLTVYQM